MVCPRCPSDKLTKFNAEISIHFPGWRGLDKPTVLVFPQLDVCLKCGFAEFHIREGELRKLVEDRLGLESV